MLVVKKPVKTNKKKSKILIVDDHPVVRYGVTKLINSESDLTVCGEAENTSDAAKFLKENKVDAVILDISLEGVLDGLKLTKVLRAKYPELPVLILSMHDEMTYAQKALLAGANGFIMKEESSEQLVFAIREVLNGDIYVSDNVKQQMLQTIKKPINKESDITDKLSDRERQVFLLIGSGHTTRSISDKLSVSIKTVETHRSRIKFKLGISTTPELVLKASNWAKRERIILPQD